METTLVKIEVLQEAAKKISDEIDKVRHKKQEDPVDRLKYIGIESGLLQAHLVLGKMLNQICED